MVAVLAWLYANVLGNLVASGITVTAGLIWHHRRIADLMWRDHRETRQHITAEVAGHAKHTRDELGALADNVTREHAATRQLIDPDPHTQEHP